MLTLHSESANAGTSSTGWTAQIQTATHGQEAPDLAALRVEMVDPRTQLESSIRTSVVRTILNTKEKEDPKTKCSLPR